MTNDEIKQLIRDTVNTTVLQLRAAGMLLDQNKTAYEKTEMLLRQYPQLCKVDEPYARKVVAEIDACMAAHENDPYLDVIRLHYFGGVTNLGCAKIMCADDRNLRRNRKRLVEEFSVRLASEEFIRELLL